MVSKTVTDPRQPSCGGRVRTAASCVQRQEALAGRGTIDTRFFAAAVVGDTTQTRGAPACVCGHRIRRGAGESDDGIFAEWHWDGERLSVINDRYGMYPLFYCAQRDAIWVSPSIVTLVQQGAPADLDYTGLSVFLRLGFFIGDDTPFQHIKALPANANLKWHRGELQVDGHRVLRGPDHLRRDAALDGYIELFRRAIRRRVPQDADFAVPVSAGRDSRHILLELSEQGYRPKFCVTAEHYPPRPNEDARVASLLTAALGIPHVILEQLDRFDAERRKNLATSFCADEHAWAVTLADFLCGRVGTVFDGMGGDVLSAGHFLTAQRQALCDEGRVGDLAEVLVPRSNDRLLFFLLRSDVRALLTREYAVRRVAAELERHLEAPNPIGAFFFWNRTRREITLIPYALLRSVADVFTPYLDHELYDFLASLPASLLLDHRLHTDAIMRGYPKYRHIPFQGTNVPRPDAGAMRRHFLRRLAHAAELHSEVAPSLLATRHSSLCIEWASFTRRFVDVGHMTNPELILYLLQLERFAERGRLDESTGDGEV